MAIVVITDHETIKRRLLNFVEETTGLLSGAVFWAEDDFERPALPYATIAITSDGFQVGQDERLNDIVDSTPELTRTTRGARRMTLHVIVFTNPVNVLSEKDSMDHLRDLVSMIKFPTIVEANRAACLAILDHEPIINISELVGERYERRASVDLFINYMVGISEGGLTDAWIDTIEPITVSDGTLILNE